MFFTSQVLLIFRLFKLKTKGKNKKKTEKVTENVKNEIKFLAHNSDWLAKVTIKEKNPYTFQAVFTWASYIFLLN